MLYLRIRLKSAAFHLEKCLRRRRAALLLFATLVLLLIIQVSLTATSLQIRDVRRAFSSMQFNYSGKGAPGSWKLGLYSGHDRWVDPDTGKVPIWDVFFGSKTAKPVIQLPLCSDPPPGLGGHVDVTYQRLQWRELERLYPDVDAGGRWRPANCVSRHHVAIIVPYRDRGDHLRVFLHHIHPFLQKQLVNYGIYVIEQDPYSPFNRGLLLNIGFREAMADENYTCAIFHDVDLLPEDDRNLYYCPEQPRHMSAAVDEFAYKLPYAELFGGIEAFTKEHFELINGFSNKYFGWGAEDDDLYKRIDWHGLNLTRYPMEIARYSMIRHMKNEPNPSRLDYLKVHGATFRRDGLSSLEYDRKRFERRKLFTWIYARVNQTAILKDSSKLRYRRRKSTKRPDIQVTQRTTP